MAAARDVQALLQTLRGGTESARHLHLAGGTAPEGLTLAWPGMGDILPDGALPRGVVELAAPRALGGSTRMALAAVRAGQARGADAWCAWIDPEGTLYAPALVAAGVHLARLLVVRPPRDQLGRVAVRTLGAGAFEVLVIDYDAVPGAASVERAEARRKSWAPEVLVRKLALSAEACGATVLLLTDSERPRATPWPVALRLELSRPRRGDLTVRVAKDRRGRIGLVKTVPFFFAG